MAEGGGADTLWATAAVMFAGALLTGLPAVRWTAPDAEAEVAAEKASGGRRGGGGGGGAMRLAQALLQVWWWGGRGAERGSGAGERSGGAERGRGRCARWDWGISAWSGMG
mgnify:CR=1 FL=1